MAAIRPFAAEPDEPAFTGAGFRAHVTHKPPARLHPGATLALTQLALVDMSPAPTRRVAPSSPPHPLTAREP